MMAHVQDLLRVLPEDKSERNLRSLWVTENNVMILLHSLERNPVFKGTSWVPSTSSVKGSLTELFRILTKVVFTTYGKLCGSNGKIQTITVKS